MPPTVALLTWFALLLALLYFDPAKERKVSPATWIPVLWIFILGTRMPSQWFGGTVGISAGTLEEGNPIDRTVSSLLLLLAISILISRSFKWGAFFTRNAALTVFLIFALFSVVWSDFPLIALKHWFRDLGDYFVVLVALTDPYPLEAVRTVFRRVNYLMVPLSIVLVKYYPATGRAYSYYTGAVEYVGAATSKNMLGLICLVSGLFFFWDTAERWKDRTLRRTKRILFLNFASLGMTFWLMNLSRSTTSEVCLALGCLVIAATHVKFVRRWPSFLKALIPAAFIVYIVLAFGFGMNGNFAADLGKDPTLTDRTKIWAAVLAQHTNPVLGTGYESFWLGPRLFSIWHSGLGGINEAHDGYLEMYLNLGALGVCLFCGFLIASYRTICARFSGRLSIGSLGMAMWFVLLFYSVTEAGFRSGLMWVTFLISALAVPGRFEVRQRRINAIGNSGGETALASSSSELFSYSR